MAKKITTSERKKLLKLYREGATYTRIMAENYIGDLRTLKRHLAIAEEEEKIERVEERQLQEATTRHLADIRRAIEKWREYIQASDFAISEDALVHCRHIEEEAIFDCIKQHLPFESLWRDYEDWKRGHIKYVGWGKRLLEDVVRQGETKMKLSRRNDYYRGARLTGKFVNPMIERLEAILSGENPRAFEFRWQEMVNQEGEGIMVLYVDGEDVMVVKPGESPEQGYERWGYERRYQEVFEDCVEMHIRKLFKDLSILEHRLQRQLEEILIRQDYICYSCTLCPGRRPSK